MTDLDLFWRHLAFRRRKAFYRPLEIKHDGFRFICLRDGKLARLHPRLLARLDLCHHKLELARGRDVERLDGLRDGGVLVLRAASGCSARARTGRPLYAEGLVRRARRPHREMINHCR